MFLFWWQIKTKQDFLKFIKQDDIETDFLTDLVRECIEAINDNSFNEYGYIHKMLETVNSTENKSEILSNKEVIDNIYYIYKKRGNNSYNLTYTNTDFISNDDVSDISVIKRNAKESYEKTEEVIYNKYYRTFTDVYRLVFKEIEKAINNGKFSTVIDLNEVFIPCELYGCNIASIIYNLKTELTNLGYKFKLIPNIRFDRPEFNIEVNWSNADTTLEEIKSELGR